MGASEEYFEYGRLFALYSSGRRDPWTPGDSKNMSEEARRQYARESEVLRISHAIGPGLNEDEFKELVKQIESLQSEYYDARDGKEAITQAEYQKQIWQLPEIFNAARQAIVHYRPKRSASGEPVPPPTSNPGAGSIADDLSIDPPISTIPEQADLGSNIGAALSDMVRNAAMEAVPDDHVRMYHGGRIVDGKHALTSFMEDAQSEAERAGKALQYIDLPKSHDIFKPGVLEGSDAKPRFDVAYASSDIAGGLRNLPQGPDASIDALKDAVAKLAGGHAQSKEEQFQQLVASENVLKEEQLQDFMKGLFGDHWEAQKGEGFIPEIAGGESGGQGGNWLDGLQTMLDAVGVADPTPIADLSNAGISLFRALSEPGRAGEHLFNAGVSAVSAIPYVGDIAKVGKYGLKGAGMFGKGGRGVKAASESTAGLGQVAQGMAAHHGLGPGHGGGGGRVPPGSNAHYSFPGGTGGGAGGDGGAGQMLSALGDTLVGLAGKAGTGVVAITGLITVMRKWDEWCNQVSETNKRLIEDTRHLAKYNSELSVAYMQLDADRYLRDVARAGAMAGPTGRLAGAQSRYEAASEFSSVPYQQLYTDLRAILTDVLAGINMARAQMDPILMVLKAMYGLQVDDARSRVPAEDAAERFCDLPNPILPPIPPRR